ncbi:hypothetical protein LSTR_LSTR017549 [Laodelphax striatellus]|uniref:Uncharacterized protein n=1 Tax=Laodelphax striatellus TaxID=195883 RepID=A0A482WVU9_LAOST|nr:hypothetical protein LSTR_LSTR017549 [Laodelphax striatellus]
MESTRLRRKKNVAEDVCKCGNTCVPPRRKLGGKCGEKIRPRISGSRPSRRGKETVSCALWFRISISRKAPTITSSDRFRAGKARVVNNLLQSHCVSFGGNSAHANYCLTLF